VRGHRLPDRRSNVDSNPQSEGEISIEREGEHVGSWEKKGGTRQSAAKAEMK
jgi:hypothetical protein